MKYAGLRCSARAKSTGGQCRRWAIAGGTVCPVHGGRAPQVKRAARRRLEEMRVKHDLGKLLAELEVDGEDVDAGEVLAEQVRRASAMVVVLGAIVGQLDGPGESGRASVLLDDLAELAEQYEAGALTAAEYERAKSAVIGSVPAGALFGPDHLGDGRPHVAVAMYADWIERAGRLSKLAGDLGIDERRLHINQAIGQEIADVMRDVIAGIRDLFIARLKTSELGLDESDVAELFGQAPKIVRGVLEAGIVADGTSGV